MFDKPAFIQRAEKFIYEIDMEAYENSAGLKDTMNTSNIFERYADMFSSGSILAVNDARALHGTDAEMARQLQYLQRFIVEGFLDNDVRELNDKIATVEAQAKITVDGSEHPYRFAQVLIMNEDDRARRIRIDHARDPVINNLNMLLKERLNRIHGLAHSLGYGNYYELYRDIKGIDFYGFSKLLDGFCANTEQIYKKYLKDSLDSINITLDEAEKSDINYIFRAKSYDSYFGKARVYETLKRTLSGIGFELESQNNIKVDIEEREKKSPRAFCVPLRMPDEIILVTMPHGGQDDYQAMLHEAGHAEHFANTNRNLPFEYKYIGDVSVSESYAFLFNYLVGDPEWLSEYVGMKDANTYLKFHFFNKLFFLRRYTAKLKYEIELHKDMLNEGDRLYSETLGKIIGIKHPGHHYLIDLDDGFYSSQYLRAWVFEAQLRTTIKEKFGDRWFTNKSSGEYLRSLYAYGAKYNVEELAQRIGWKGLDSKPLADEIINALKE